MRTIDRVWTGLTAVLLVLTVVSCICVATLFVNPDGVFTFLAGPTDPIPEPLATVPPFRSATPTIIYPTLPPEWTATATATEAATELTADDTTEAVTGGTGPNGSSTPVPSPIGPTATDTEQALPTRTPTAPAAQPSRTGTPRSYPGPTPGATATAGGYP
jgi:hypothetical protein